MCELDQQGHIRRGVKMDFYSASALGLIDIVRNTLLCGQKVDERNENGWTGLMYACAHERNDVVNFLVSEKVADKTVLTKQNRTALMIAAISGNVHNLDKVFHESIIDFKDIYDYTALFYAVIPRHYACVKYLLERGCKTDTICNDRTPLMYSSEKNDVLMVQLLLKHNAQPNILNSEGRKAIDYAQEPRIIRFLNVYGENDIQKILTTEGLGNYWKNFQENNVTFQQFINMTEYDMKKIGMSKFGPRRRLSQIIAAIQAKLP